MKKLFSFLSDFRKNSLKILIFALYYLLSWNLYFCERCVCRWNVEFVRYRIPGEIRGFDTAIPEYRLKQIL